MRIAVIASDREKLSSHFGEAPMFLIYEIDGNQPRFVEVRENPVKDAPGYHHHGEAHTHGEGFGMGRGMGGGRGMGLGMGRGMGRGMGGGRGKWHVLADMLSDCDVIIGRGMGPAAYQNFQSIGKKVILSKEIKVEEALKKFIAGELEHDPRRVKYD